MIRAPEGHVTNALKRYVKSWMSVCLAVALFAADRPVAVAAQEVVVGFQKIDVPQPGETPLHGAIWYPSHGPTKGVPAGLAEQTVNEGGQIVGHKMPLIVFSHGSLGTWQNNVDTAVALAGKGFVVAAITYDTPAHDGVMRIIPHGQRLRDLIDFALFDWSGHSSIDGNEIGALGFSLGAFTVLTEIGGIPDLILVSKRCSADFAEWSCIMYHGEHLDILKDSLMPLRWPVEHRIKAAVIIAPVLGYTFRGEALAAVNIPIQLWQGSEDRTAIGSANSDIIRRGLPQAPEFHMVAGAVHGDFTAPCGPAVAAAKPNLCEDQNGFSRSAFHKVFNEAIGRFFVKTLMTSPPTSD